MIAPVYLAAAARTPIGAFLGSLSEVGAAQLGSAAVSAALSRAGLSPAQVDEVIFGNVISAGLGQNIARQVALGAGLPPGAGATSVNKVCGSGLKAVMLAAQAIQCGDASVIIAGGTESMSQAPYLLPRARTGYRMGNGELVDAMIHDGLWDAYHNVHMGICGDECAAEYQFSRRQQDDFAVASFERALAAEAEGAFAAEIAPLDAPRGKTVERVAEDETPRKFNEAKLRQLKPAFSPTGTVTAGNASSLNDGAAAVAVLSESAVQSLGIRPIARILGCATASQEPRRFTTAPIGAIRKLADRANLKLSRVDLFEINEAFAVVAMAAMRDLELPHEKVNVHGGAIALGHPIGASGARTLVTLLNAMRRRGGKIGVDALCLGGGEAVAMAVELV